jgi:hypothetical protein
MMRWVLAAAVCAMLFGCDRPARAGDVSVVVTEQEQASWEVVADLFEKCIGAAVARGDATMCRQVFGFTAGFGAKVAATAQRAKAPAAPEGKQ